ncbi:MAG: DUF1896 family protein [Parafilimonas sp.]
MRDILKNKLHQYISENNPDLLLSLEEKKEVTQYLTEKVNGIESMIQQLQVQTTPAYIIEEMCLDELTKDLRPSRYNYISNILEEDFEFAHQQFQKRGTLLYEVVNILNQCQEAFETFGFTEETEDNRQLRYAVTGIIDKYLSK